MGAKGRNEVESQGNYIKAREGREKMKLEEEASMAEVHLNHN
jgi:hypothetical protein